MILKDPAMTTEIFRDLFIFLVGRMYTVLKWLLGEPRAGETAFAINNWHQSNSGAVIEVSLHQYVNDERIHSDERNNLQKLAFDHHIPRSRCQHHFIIQ